MGVSQRFGGGRGCGRERGGLTLVGFCDVSKEDGANDTTSAPHECDARVIEIPAIIMGSSTHKHESLSIRNEFRRIQSLEKRIRWLKVGGCWYLFKFIDESFLVAFEMGVGTIDLFRCSPTFITDRRKTARKDSFSNQSYRLSKIESINRSPFSSSLYH